MNKVLIDRELLERAVYRLELVYDADAPIVCDLSSVLSAPSGTPAMPVKAYYHEAPNEYGGLNKSVGLEVRKQFNDAPLVLESDALARVSHLEGEIDKRDARIAELEARYQRDVYGLNNEGDPIGGDPAGGYANDNARLRSELARFSGTPETQVSVPASAFASRAITHYEAALLAAFPSGSSGEVFNQWNEARRVLASAPAAPAADAGLVYDKELHEAWTDRLIDLTKSYREAADGGEVRDAFRAIKAHIEVQPMSMVIEMTNNTIPNVPDGWKLVPVEPTPEMISAAGGAITTPDDLPPVGAGGWSMNDLAFRSRYRDAISAAPAAPAADAGLIEALGYQALFDAIAAATSVYANGAVNISVQAFRDALAASRAKGVV